MESDCRIQPVCQFSTRLTPRLSFSPRCVAVYTVLWLLTATRICGAAVKSEDQSKAMAAGSAPCWQVEEFVVAQECSQCTAFEAMSWLACSTTGFVEKINCATSKKDEYKSCRSAVMEERLFWQFEGSMVGLTLVFSFLVVVRQRALDRLASEKVRKQIESI
ncbi:protein JTB [Polyodon spathula]|uniref:protein JTB n=1 Tax=Polyodon spathula TaxID=7913 RepID=UPI001B7DF3AB|nr:protein JTB [Polyodon spathula]